MNWILDDRVNIPINSELKYNHDNILYSEATMDLPGTGNSAYKEIHQITVSKSIPHTSNFTPAVLGTELVSDDENDDEFSTNCDRFLYLNTDYNKQNIAECIQYLTSNFLTSEFLRVDNMQECSSSDEYKRSTNPFKDNTSSVQKTASIISTDLVSNSNFDTGITHLEENPACPEYFNSGYVETFTNEFPQDVLQTASLLNSPIFGFDTSHSNIELAPIQYSNTFAVQESNNLYNYNRTKNSHVSSSHRSLSSSQIQNSEKLHQDRDLVSNLSTSKPANNINNSVTYSRQETNSEPPCKKMKGVDKNYMSSEYSNSIVKTVDSAEYNAISCASASETISSKSSTSKHSIGDPRKSKTGEYSQYNITPPCDPRLWKASTSNVTHQNNSTPSFNTQTQSIGTLSSIITPLDTIKTTSISADPRRFVEQLPEHLHVSAEITSFLQGFPGNLDPSSQQSFSGPMAKMQDDAAREGAPTKDLIFHIIEWKTGWLNMQKSTGKRPKPVGQCPTVNNKYQCCAEYRNTYHSLHLLNIWELIYESWLSKPPTYKAELVSYEKSSNYYENTCKAVMPSEDIPIHQGIIQIMHNNRHCKVQGLFGYVYKVSARDIYAPEKSRSVIWKEVLFSFYTVKKLGVKMKGTVDICKFFRVRVAVDQYHALGEIHSHPMKDVILNPGSHAQEIQLIFLPHTYTQSVMQVNVNKIIDCVMSPRNKFTLVDQESRVDPIFTLLMLVRTLFRRSAILVCLANAPRFFKFCDVLIKNCADVEIVLGIKESEVSIPINLQEYTLRSHAARQTNIVNLKRAESEVLGNNRIIVTLLSSVFLGVRKCRSLGPDLTCIIDDAHLSTEAETALPLSFKPRNVVLLGEKNVHMEMNSILKYHLYHKSLFHRLLEEKRETDKSPTALEIFPIAMTVEH